jgi:hypothetical protein
MSLPTRGEEFSKLIEHIRLAQEAAAMLAHLNRDTSKAKSDGWIAISEMFKRVQYQVIQLANRGLQ